MIGNKIGKLGEDLVEKFLVKQGFKVLMRNYLKKYGEIDIVAEKKEITHFIEVKTVSRETIEDVSDETSYIRPEENLHGFKLKRLSNVIQSYILEKDIKGDWKFDLFVVYVDVNNKQAKIKPIFDLVLPE